MSMSNLKENQELAERFGLQRLNNPLSTPFVAEGIQKLPYRFVKEKLVLPVDERGGVLILAVARPYDLEVIEEVRCLTGMGVEELYCPDHLLEEAIEKCYHQREKEASRFIEGLKKERSQLGAPSQEDGYDLLDTKDDSPVIRLLNMIMIEAIQQGASDIHFEPLENEMGVRYRIDGVLQFRHSPPRNLSKQLLTRIKVIAKLDIAEQRLPQDGRIKLQMGGRQIDFRVSTVPVVHGERVVLRILDKNHIRLGLNKLGMREGLLESFRKYIRQNQGIILVTGPTGSGKTTTLYSAIHEIQSQELNVMTIEDPVEYKLPKIAQIGVNLKTGLTFAKGLKHILRQDPDVMMVGEIRDKETAEIAIQSSLTGHLVLSTLHTNDAPSALTRLVDMGIEPYLLTSSILAVLAQRLVRRICDKCKEEYEPSEGELEGFELETQTLYRGAGCQACYGSGYRGRVGIYELMPVNGHIKKQLLRSADANEIQKIASELGMASLRKEGGNLAKEGLTTTAEILRVTRQTDLYESI